MSEDMAVTLARLEELTTTAPEGDPLDQPLRLFGYEVVATLLEHIRELQKRIGELEADLAQTNRERLSAIDLLTAERQRREEAGASLCSNCTCDVCLDRYASEAALDPHPSSSGNEPGNHRGRE
jgi:hypothetical protein